MIRPLRDGLLAFAALATLVAVAVATGAGAVLLRPVPAVAGAGGALALETVLLRYPDRTRALWERPAVQALAFAGVGVVAVRSGLAPVLAALAWGLVAYLCLLAVVAAGYRDPVA